MPPPDRDAGAALATENLSLSYGRGPIVAHLDLAFRAGALTTLLGPNGSGKSTCLRALAGLLAPKGGAVLLEGASIAHLSTKALAQRIGFLHQGPPVPEGLTVEDLVRQGRYPHRALFGAWSARDESACEEALMLTGTTDLRHRLLDSLSGGQRQRAWIAMTLAQETDILLLDEPTSFLDLAHQIELMELAAGLVRRGKTVVAVLHDLNQAARYADHIVLLKAGRLCAAGDPATVITAANIHHVFEVAVTVIEDPVAGTPLCLPLPRSGRPRCTVE